MKLEPIVKVGNESPLIRSKREQYRSDLFTSSHAAGIAPCESLEEE